MQEQSPQALDPKLLAVIIKALAERLDAFEAELWEANRQKNAFIEETSRISLKLDDEIRAALQAKNEACSLRLHIKNLEEALETAKGSLISTEDVLKEARGKLGDEYKRYSELEEKYRSLRNQVEEFEREYLVKVKERGDADCKVEELRAEANRINGLLQEERIISADLQRRLNRPKVNLDKLADDLWNQNQHRMDSRQAFYDVAKLLLDLAGCEYEQSWVDYPR